VSDDRPVASRESLIARTFIEIADTLVGDFDVIDMLTTLAHRSVQLLDVAAAGILLADSEGHLRVMAASSDEVELLELFQIQNDEGPCMDSFAAGTMVAAPDLTAVTPWPRFAAESLAGGFASVCAVPLRLRADTIGCVNLFMASSGGLSEGDVEIAQALTDVACIVICQNEASRSAARREEQLQQALNSRVLIEQAKGVIAERAGVAMDEAFGRLRRYARNNNLRLSDLAGAVIAGTVDVDAVVRNR
jgi:transcriptional regulator with GAF, ATPase, and Fis domain